MEIIIKQNTSSGVLSVKVRKDGSAVVKYGLKEADKERAGLTTHLGKNALEALKHIATRLRNEAQELESLANRYHQAAGLLLPPEDQEDE